MHEHYQAARTSLKHELDVNLVSAETLLYYMLSTARRCPIEKCLPITASSNMRDDVRQCAKCQTSTRFPSCDTHLLAQPSAIKTGGVKFHNAEPSQQDLMQYSIRSLYDLHNTAERQKVESKDCIPLKDSAMRFRDKNRSITSPYVLRYSALVSYVIVRAAHHATII